MKVYTGPPFASHKSVCDHILLPISSYWHPMRSPELGNGFLLNNSLFFFCFFWDRVSLNLNPHGLGWNGLPAGIRNRVPTTRAEIVGTRCHVRHPNGCWGSNKVPHAGAQAVYWLIHSPFLSKEIWWKGFIFFSVKGLNWLRFCFEWFSFATRCLIFP